MGANAAFFCSVGTAGSAGRRMTLGNRGLGAALCTIVQKRRLRCAAGAHLGVVVWVWSWSTVALVRMPWHSRQRSDVGAPVLARTR